MGPISVGEDADAVNPAAPGFQPQGRAGAGTGPSREHWHGDCVASHADATGPGPSGSDTQAGR